MGYTGPCQISVVASNICGTSSPGQCSLYIWQVPTGEFTDFQVVDDSCCGQVYLSWIWNGTGQDGFNIYRNSELIDSVAGNTIVYIDMPDTNVLYEYYISAYNLCGDILSSTDSGGAQVSIATITPESLEITLPDTMPPDTFVFEIVWGWNDSILINHFYLEKSTDNGNNWDSVATLPYMILNYSDTVDVIITSYRICAINSCDNSLWNEQQTPTSIEGEITILPRDYYLAQSYPNPFNPIATIEYGLPEDIFVIIKIYDILGRAIAILVNEHKSAGSYKAHWDAKNQPSGMYFYKIQAGKFRETKKMLLLK
jgi:hypothetical protein